MQDRNLKRAFSAIEMLIYIAILAIVTTALTFLSINVLRAIGQARAQRTVDQAGEIAMERIIREIRMAQSLSGEPASSLSLRTFANSDPSSGLPDIRTFSLSGDAIMMQDSSGNPSGTSLTSSANIAISALTFQEIAASDIGAAGVMVQFTATCKRCKTPFSRTFRTMANIRGEY